MNQTICEKTTRIRNNLASGAKEAAEKLGKSGKTG
jgi:hypothetical protein